jgi:hypothetical protein
MRALLLKLTCGPPGVAPLPIPRLPKWPTCPAPLTVDAGSDSMACKWRSRDPPSGGATSDNAIHRSPVGQKDLNGRVDRFVYNSESSAPTGHSQRRQ